MDDATRDKLLMDLSVGMAEVKTLVSELPAKFGSQQDQLNTLFAHHATNLGRLQKVEVQLAKDSGRRSGRSSTWAVVSAIVAAVVALGSAAISGCQALKGGVESTHAGQP